MFEDSVIVPTAVSAFNNAALGGPLFWWVAILMLPLFVWVWRYGNAALRAQKLWPGLGDASLRGRNFALIIQILIFGWLLLMGGNNYNVLRDGASVMPYVVAGLLFVTAAGIVRRLRVINPPLPAALGRMRPMRRRAVIGAGVVAISLLAGFGGAPGWTGFLMQAAAVLCGVLAGRGMRGQMSPVFITTVSMFAVATLILMQPEFFRFGQLDRLGPVHILTLMLVAATTAATLALRNFRAHKWLRETVFVKIKWTLRFVAALCGALFWLTESVPLFLAMTLVLGVSFVVSIWHADDVPADLGDRMWAVLMCAFGTLTIMPVITVLGICYWTGLPRTDLRDQIKTLL